MHTSRIPQPYNQWYRITQQHNIPKVYDGLTIVFVDMIFTIHFAFVMYEERQPTHANPCYCKHAKQDTRNDKLMLSKKPQGSKTCSDTGDGCYTFCSATRNVIHRISSADDHAIVVRCGIKILRDFVL